MVSPYDFGFKPIFFSFVPYMFEGVLDPGAGSEFQIGVFDEILLVLAFKPIFTSSAD